MDEDAGVKAAALRPRRRPSVEQVDSPSTPATPTKKRGTRLAAKPQLELIDEHAVTNSPSKRPTRKSVARELIEPEEKPVTPARRSARVKSNTSLVLEPEEKATTPAKRAARIKSNSSIVSEPTQAEDTPRAKRAARRLSQAGSDTDLSLTPTRATRRTRKTSTSSIDKEGTSSVSESAVTPGRARRTRKGSTSSIDNTPAEASPADKPTSLITEVIIEEPENKLTRKSTSETDNGDNRTESPSMRRSPRIMAKTDRKSNPSNDTEIRKDVSPGKTNQEMKKTEYLTHDSTANTDISKHDISAATSNLIRDLDKDHKKKTHDKNKSLSDIEDFKNKRHRTKSSMTLSSPIPDSHFFSDNESTKKKLKKKGKMIQIVINKRQSISGSGNDQEKNSSNAKDETSLNTSTKSKRNSLIGKNLEAKRHRTKSWTNLSSPTPDSNFLSDNESTKKKLKNKGKMIKIVIDKKQPVSGSGDDQEKEEISLNTSRKSRKSKINSITVDTETPAQLDSSNESNKENILEVATLSKDSSAVDIMLEKAPSGIKTMVLIEDSDSNSGSIHKSNHGINNEADDQCISVMLDLNEKQTSIPENVEQNIFAVTTETENNLSVEPMDIDETMPENISLTVFNETGKQSRKSSLCLSQESDKEMSKKSKRKSSLLTSVSQALDNIETERENENLHKSLINVSQDNERPEDAIHKTKRKSSLLQNSDTGQEILKKSKRKSSVSHTAVDQEKIETSKQRSSFSENNEESAKLVKSLLSVAQEPESTTYDTPNKSKRKSSLSHSITQDLDRTPNENKTTLVLSQIKDTSAESYTSTSPQDVKEKSVMQDIKGGPVNKNLDLDYLTSTPVQQKSIDKITMQMNTSVITPNNVSKKDFKNTSNTSEAEEIGYKKKKSKRLSESTCKDTSLKKETQKQNSATVGSMKESSSDDSEESTDEDEESSKSKFVDDEAEDAGEDYESGDSQDEEERLYEKENEILEHGETLNSDSEDEDSEDTDYEKDSFIVSSDEDDNELLSGSGDDLDMSDNELKMIAKSKKKYNERKLKEQKKASREMYEARHGLNKTDIAKKKSRNRLDSTLLKSDDENLPPKKNKRMRLESSTLESSRAKSDSEETTKKNVSNVSSNEDVGYIKKKSKRLSESLCNESDNEKEMTIINTESKKQDPLSVNVKVEPKTPQKYLEISTYQINEEIEQIQVDENTSIMKPNDTIDPLQATMAADENEPSDDESISENEEIVHNYDSLLKQLNEKWKHPIKSHDISLNLNKKSKKTKEPVIDKLNVTGTKPSKKLRDDSKEAKEKSVKRVFKKLAAEDDSSKDSIDLKLLFSDESNDKPHEEKDETFIHLKKTAAKTDIREISGSNEDITNKSLNTSPKKKNRKSNGAHMESEEMGESVKAFSFFIDTKGDLPDKKSKDGQISDSNEPPVEVFYVNQKNKKANNNSKTVEVTTEVTKIPASEKKKKKKVSESLNIAELELENGNIKSAKRDKKKKKLSVSSEQPETSKSEIQLSEKKTKKISDSKDDIIQAEPDKTENPKKKKLSVSSEQPETSESEIRMHKTPSEKKTKNKSDSKDNIIQAEPDKAENPKKKKKKNSESDNETSQTEVDHNIPKPVISEKKSKKVLDTLKDLEYPDKTSTKKRKRNTSANDTIDLDSSQKIDEPMAGSQKKKIKVSHATNEIAVESVPQVNEPEAGHKPSKKTKKNKNLESETDIKRNKRKQRDEDEGGQASKIFKEHSFDKVHVPRLPSSILAQLDNDRQPTEKQKNKVVSTSNFIIEETVKRKNKPSKYLEESVYLNDPDDEEIFEKKKKLPKPKVLPFLPLVSTSDSGFTTNFRVKVISDTMEFIAKSNDVPNFKNNYLNDRKVKKLRAYDVCKKQRYMKLNKY